MLYDREAAVTYAHRWAFSRNPQYYNFDNLGGDCTNFASQCLFAGGGVMNFEPTFGWYYINANKKAPAWTGVPYIFNFLTRREKTAGPFARICALEELQPGDLVQLSFRSGEFQHSPVVVEAKGTPDPSSILVAAHTDDADYRPLATYLYRALRPLHIEGVMSW